MRFARSCSPRPRPARSALGAPPSPTPTGCVDPSGGRRTAACARPVDQEGAQVAVAALADAEQRRSSAAGAPTQASEGQKLCVWATHGGRGSGPPTPAVAASCVGTPEPHSCSARRVLSRAWRREDLVRPSQARGGTWRRRPSPRRGGNRCRRSRRLHVETVAEMDRELHPRRVPEIRRPAPNSPTYRAAPGRSASPPTGRSGSGPAPRSPGAPCCSGSRSRSWCRSTAGSPNAKNDTTRSHAERQARTIRGYFCP